MARRTPKPKPETKRKRSGPIKVPIRKIEDVELDRINCCGVAEALNARSLSSVEDALALRMAIHPQSGVIRTGYVIATTVNERKYVKVEGFLKAARFKKIATFVNHNTGRGITLWGAMPLKPRIDWTGEDCPDCEHKWHGKRLCAVKESTYFGTYDKCGCFFCI